MKKQAMHHAKRAPKLTDAERHTRFVEAAEKVGASDDPKAFDEAFTKVVLPSSSSSREKIHRVRKS